MISANYTMSDLKFLLRLVEEIKNKITTVSTLKSKLKVINSTYLIRSLAWMNKFDIIGIQIS